MRLGHSGLFTTGRAEMWRNASVFTAKTGAKCGLYLHEFAEARGRLILFYPDEQASAETRFHFEEFVLAHANHHALDGTVEPSSTLEPNTGNIVRLHGVEVSPDGTGYLANFNSHEIYTYINIAARAGSVVPASTLTGFDTRLSNSRHMFYIER